MRLSIPPRPAAEYLASYRAAWCATGGSDAFGNALGRSIAEASQPETQGQGPWSDSDYRNGSDIESDNYVAPASTYSGGQAWAADVAARRAGASGQQLDELLAGVGADGVSVDTRPGSVYAQAGDSLSKIAARFPEYGNANDLKNQLIAANPQLRDPNALTEGMELNFPGAGTVVDRAAMARALGADGRYQAALAAQQPEAQEPVWNMRDASAASMARAAQAVGTGEWFKTASVAELHAAGYQTVSAYDPAPARAADVRRESLLNYLNGQGSMAIGGVLSAGVMLATNDVFAASQATDVLEPIDSLLAPMGGGSATRLGRAPGSRPIDYAKTYEADVRGLYGDVPFQQRTYTALVNGERVRGVADNVTMLDGMRTAVEAKYVDNWATSLRNPTSSEGDRPWAVAEQQKMLDQAAKYGRAFEQTIYHTNSVDLANHYTPLFQQAGVSNFRFVISPPITPKP